MSDEKHSSQRSETYDRMLLAIDRHIAALPVSILTDFHHLSPTAAAQDATREVWQLLAKGVRHLKSGSPDGSPGTIAGAIEKASLRASSLAVTIGVKPPNYVPQPFDLPYFQDGKEEAVFYAARLLEALEADLGTSTQKITAKLGEAKPAHAFGDPEMDAAQLQKIFEAVKDGSAAPALPQRDLVDIRKQTVMSFNFLTDAYPKVLAEFAAELDSLPQLPPKQRPHQGPKSFDL
ncbi:MAG TPA: hypothetical protein VEF76_01320 [Patescibacteria group bacterium]|nr:hypothetical protein [Patescibacteria group bacterium]